MHLTGPFDHHLCGQVTQVLRELKRAGAAINIEGGFRRLAPLALGGFNLLTERQLFGSHAHIAGQHALLGADIVCPARIALNEEEAALVVKADRPAQKRQGLLARLAFEGNGLIADIVTADRETAERNHKPRTNADGMPSQPYL